MKNIIIAILLLATIGLLVYVATQPTLKTEPIQPEQEIQVTPQQPLTPKATESDRGTPTPKAQEPTAPGLNVEQIFPDVVNFWVDEIQIPESMSYESYIPLKQSSIKTFAGTFGPYATEPKLVVVLCAELYKTPGAPNCEKVQTIYRNGYVSFAKGYQYDEYIGGIAAKDYAAYYDVYVGDTKVASSNKGIVRTVKD